MTDTIKITSLSPMGTTIPGSSLAPVVDMSGTPTTKKATIANIANAILSQAGNGYVYAAKANLANVAGQATTVTQASQPNITSVGTLTSLTVSGETVLGPVGNVVITGGTNGYVLQTDGTGNLSWTAQTGNGGGGNTTPGGANTQVQFNDAGEFGGNSGFTFNKTTGNLVVVGNIRSDETVYANVFRTIGETNLALWIGSPNGFPFTFTTGGAFEIPGGHVLESNGDGEFEIKSNSGVVISSDIANTNQHFSFRTDGIFHAPSNVQLEGTRLSIGPGAANVELEAPTVVINANSNVYVQAALTNENANGSADWVAYGTDGTDAGGWTDFGFTGYNFSDANYNVTSEGDGYVFVQGYANGTGGGNLVLATGGQGTDKNIIFSTGGFSNSNIKATLYHANGAFDVVGNVSANWVIGDYVSGNANPLHHLPAGNLTGVDGNSSNILYGNGIFAAASGGNPFNQDLNTTDNVTFANITSTDVIKFSNSGNIVGAMGYAPNYVSIEGYQSNSIVVTANDIYSWTFDGNGNLTIPNGGYINFVNTGGITQAVNEDLRFTVSDDEQDGWAIESIVNDGAGNNLTQMQVRYDGVRINTDLPTNNYSWDFRDTGEFDVPKSIRGPVGGNLVISIGDQSGSNTFIDLQTRSYVGDALISNIRIANPNVTVSTASGAYNWTFGDTGNLTLPGNTFAVNYANGSQVPLGTISSLVNGNNSFVLDSAGNVVFEGLTPGEGVDRGLVWDYGANANGVNSMIRQDLNGLTVRAWTEDSGNYTAPVNIITGQDANAKTWRFDGQGNLTVPSGSINSIDSVGDLGAYITLNPDLGLATLAGRNALSNVGYTNTAWSTATYTGTQIDFTNAPDLVTFFNDNQFNVGVNQTISINGDEPVPFTGYSTGSSNAVTVYTSATASPDPTTVTSIDFYYQLESYVSVDYDAGTLNINATGLTINLDNDQTQGPDINLRSGDDITLQGKDKSLGSESEGGDINIYGGDGGDDDGLGNNSASGGDIQIEGGIGGSGNTGSGSSGGFARFIGGAGGDAGVGTVAGSGGYVQINAGDGGYNGGNAQLGSQGGYVEIYAGQTTLADGVGGYVEISSGTAAEGNGIAGNVRIRTPISATGQGGNWTYDGQGNLTLPNGNPYIKTSDEESTITISVAGAANNRSQFQIGSDGGTDQFTYISSQNDTNGIASFGLNAPNGVPTSAVISINNGTVLDWTFSSAALDDTEAYLYTPAGATITTPNAPSGQTGKNIFIEAGSVDQENYNTNTGGELMLKGGRGGFNDGGGGGPGGNVNINAGESADPAGHAGNVNITAGALTNWTFDYTGNLTLPANTFSVNYANGDPVTFGAAALGNVTFDNVTVQGVNGLNLSAGSDFTANLAYLQVRAGDVASHIHLDTGNNEAYDQYFGNDSKFVKLGLGIAGNVSIGTYQDGGVGQFEWIFDSNGNLVLAGGNGIVQSLANSSLDPNTANASTMVFTPDSSYSSQALVLDPTAPGHIHLRAPATLVDEPFANIFLGGENTAFEITNGANNEARIHSGGNTWAFGNTGNLTLPGNTFAINYANGTQVSLGGGYGDSNVVSLLSSFGSNTISTTGNISAGSVNLTGIVNANTQLVLNSYSGAIEGSQITLAWKEVTGLTGQGNSTWNMDSDSSNNFRIFSLNSSGTPTTNMTAYSANTDVAFGGNVVSTGKIGYSTGGTATQSSSGSSVTINQLTGKITMATRTYNDGDLEVFSLQCNKVENDDMVLIQSVDTVDCASFSVSAYPYTLLANTIRVHMRTTGNLGTYTPVLKFLIVKAPTS